MTWQLGIVAIWFVFEAVCWLIPTGKPHSVGERAAHIILDVVLLTLVVWGAS